MKLLPVVPVLLLVIASGSRADLINGDFETGDFSGWTVFDTLQGRTAVSQVILFDTAGSGTPSFSAQFQVGSRVGTDEGAGIEQSISLGSGSLAIGLDIAVSTPITNGSAGLFELWLNGSVVASYDFGSVSTSQIKRANLSYSASVASGDYEIAIDMRRKFPTDPRETPFQYLDNVTLSGSAVPDPSSATMTIALTLMLVLSRQLRHRRWNRA